MRILGIDYGSSSIKAVEMDSAFGRYDIHDYHEVPVTSDTPPDQALSQLLKNLKKTPDRIIVAMPPGQSTFRNLSLPTRDKKAIQSTIGFELEDELPFSTEQSFYDYAILTQSKQGSSIHVSATLKHHLISTIEKYQKSQTDPDIITNESWAYRILLNRVLGPTHYEAPVLLVQMGHEKTSFYLHWRGVPALIREMPWGGKDLTLAISQKYGIPIEQAESAKLDRGALVCASSSSGSPGYSEDTTPEQIEFSQCLEASLEALLTEFKQIELMCRSVTFHSINTIYVAGGTSLLPGFCPWIEEATKTPTKPLLGLSSMTSSGVTYSDQTDARFLLAACLALTQVGPDRALCINFRKRAFAKDTKVRQINFSVLKKPLMAVGIVAFCMFLSLTVQSSFYKSELKTIDIQLEKSVRSFFGQISSSGLRTYMTNTSLLSSSINKELNKQRELSRLFGPSSHSPLDFLSSLSSVIPKDTVVDLTVFQAGTSPTEPFVGSESSRSTTLTFSVANPQTAEKLASLIAGKIKNVQRGKTDEIPSPDGVTKKWNITFSGGLGEESYGK